MNDFIIVSRPSLADALTDMGRFYDNWKNIKPPSLLTHLKDITKYTHCDFMNSCFLFDKNGKYQFCLY